jgi:UDP-N-acetylmuramate--alanine ligase
MLAHLGRGMKTLAVAGTHGKTTTSSMLATMLAELGDDPTFLIGGELNDLGGNARSGTGHYYVVEADESDGSLLFLDPYVALITNIEADHLDHYSGLAEVIDTFGEFIDRVPVGGSAVVCADDAHLPELATAHCTGSVCTYGCSEGADVRCHDLTVDGIGYRFSVTFPTGEHAQARTAVRGVHNVVNATGVLATAWRLGIDAQRAADALARFTGVHRRFEHIAEVGGVTVVDDYAHHPTEVRATLAAARTAGFRRVWVVFQPHRYTRTKAFGGEFGASFGDADHVVLMEVYSAGEPPIPGVSGKTVLDALLEHAPNANTAFFPHRVAVAGYVAGRARDGDLVMTMGAGDVTTMAGEIARALEERSGSTSR